MNSKKTDLLLIDDNPTDRELFLKVLQKHSPIQRIEIAETGNQAIDLLYSTDSPIKPRLIILDLGLPGMNGIELLQTIRSKKETKAIPVIVFSGSREEEDKINTYHLGIDLYISKPIHFDQFVESVNRICQFWSKL